MKTQCSSEKSGVSQENLSCTLVWNRQRVLVAKISVKGKEISGGRGVWERQYNRRAPQRLRGRDTLTPMTQGQAGRRGDRQEWNFLISWEKQDGLWSSDEKQQWEGFGEAQRHVGDKPHKKCKVAVILVPLSLLGQTQAEGVHLHVCTHGELYTQTRSCHITKWCQTSHPFSNIWHEALEPDCCRKKIKGLHWEADPWQRHPATRSLCIRKPQDI